MDTTQPTINTSTVRLLKHKTRQKMAHHQSRVKLIDARLHQIDRELNTISAIVEYIDRYPQRKEILLHSAPPAEEARPVDDSAEASNYFRERKQQLEHQARDYSLLRTKRLERIHFMKKDIELLERIAHHSNAFSF